ASRGPGRAAAAVRFLEVAMAHIGTRAGGEKPAARSERWEAHALAEMPKAEVSAALRRQHFLYFLPLPQGQGSLRPIPRNGLIAGMSSGSSGSVGMLRTRSRSLLRFCEKLYQPDSSSMVSPNSVYSRSRADGSAELRSVSVRSCSKSAYSSQ